MPKSAKDGISLVLERTIVRGVKVDAARWDSSIIAVMHGIVRDYLAKPDAEREAFVRSLGSPQ